MNLRDFFNRKIRDGRPSESKYDSLPGNFPESSTSPAPQNVPELSEVDKSRMEKEMQDFSKVFFDYSLISKIVKEEIYDFGDETGNQIYGCFKRIVDLYLPRGYNTNYCLNLLYVISSRIFLLYGEENFYVEDGEYEFDYYNEFRQGFVNALYRICEFCEVSFPEAFSKVKNCPVLNAVSHKMAEEDLVETRLLSWTFSDFTYLLKTGNFKAIGGKESCAEDVKAIFKENFNEFLIGATDEDIFELRDFDTRYCEDSDTFMDKLMAKIDACDFVFGVCDVMAIDAIDALCKIYPQNLSQIYTFYFNMILRTSFMLEDSMDFKERFIGLIERIKDNALYRSELFYDIKMDYASAITETIDYFDGETLNAVVDLYTTVFGVDEYDLEVVIASYVQSFFENPSKPHEVVKDFEWIAKLLSNKTAYEVICNYKPSVIDMFK
ncbi:MAG: hypothetical protein IKI57_02155 [Clostridia bacterium]|nr:hypothetical protein [Clostridia bacterium]